jgi:hypothetical protein
MRAMIDLLSSEYCSPSEIIREFELSNVQQRGSKWLGVLPNSEVCWFDLSTGRCGYLDETEEVLK